MGEPITGIMGQPAQDTDKPPLRIMAAAVLHRNRIHVLLPPNRHGDIIKQISLFYHEPVYGQQGFIDNQGRFLNRCAAYQIAKFTGQLRDGLTTGELYSEDLIGDGWPDPEPEPLSLFDAAGLTPTV